MSSTVSSLDAPLPSYLRRLARRWVTAVLASFREQWWFAAIVAVEVLAAAGVLAMIHAASGAALSLYLPVYVMLMPLMVFVIILGHALYIMFVVRPARPLTMFLTDMRDKFFTVERIAVALPMLLLMPIFCSAFTVLKSSITLFSPFVWDLRLDALDRWLHGGHAPWELLQPLIGVPAITQGLNFLYNLWFFILCFVWVWQAFSLRDRQLRAQFFATLVLLWMLFGNLVATLLASAGPCYFGRVTGLPDPYAPLMDYLKHADQVARVWSLQVQDYLWTSHVESAIGLGGGISAMPSMHVAMAVLLALLFWRTNRVLGAIAAVYAVLIQVGSVHLGWHYAIDGYLGALATFAIWYLVGWIAGRARQPAVGLVPAAPVARSIAGG